MSKLNILVLDDEPGYVKEISEFLKEKGFRVFLSVTPTEATSVLKSEQVDILVLDIRLPEVNGIDFLKMVKESRPGIEVIMITGHGEIETVIKALRYGAVDFFMKPFKLSALLQTIIRSEKYLRLRKKETEKGEVISLKPSGNDDGPDLIAGSGEMKRILDISSRVARSSDTTILLTGESGTGKEMVARYIHQNSKRNAGPFYAVNCNAVPSDLFESEFFGHVKGSFTGATIDKEGWFQAASGGTLFLDEIGDMKDDHQAKLLRVIEQKKITRVGTQEELPADVRIIAATNKSLEEKVAKGRFREDLFHRLNTFVIEIPPLRKRKEAIPALFNQFVDFYSRKLGKEICYVDKKVLDLLMKYDYPGNIRELKNMVERAVIMSEEGKILADDLPALKYARELSIPEHKASGDDLNLARMESKFIRMAMIRSGNNKSGAARMLGISRQALDRKIDKLKIDY